MQHRKTFRINMFIAKYCEMENKLYMAQKNI